MSRLLGPITGRRGARAALAVGLCAAAAAASAEAAAADVSARGTLTDETGAQYAFDVTAPESGGDPSGTISLPGIPVPAPAECLVVRGARAVLAASVLSADLLRKDVYVLYAEDGDPDRFVARSEQVDVAAPVAPYCTDTDFFAGLRPVAAGEIAVSDGRPAPAPTPAPDPGPGPAPAPPATGGGTTPAPPPPDEEAPGTITSTVSHFWRVQDRRTTVLRLRVNAVPRGATVAVSCRRGNRTCPFRRRVVNRTGRVVLTRLFRGRRLRAGTIVEIRITRPRTVGVVLRFRARPRALPAVRRLCVAPGARSPRAC